MTTVADDPDPVLRIDVFSEARDQFLRSLPDQERSRFSGCSFEQVLKEIECFRSFAQSKRKWTASMKRIKDFSDSIQPYFEICTIILQSNPEWSAIAWGALLLILQLASNFVTFFDRLTEMLQRLSHSMPNYAEILQLGNVHITERVRSSLRNLYVDLFDFFKSVAQVFTQKSGKVRSTPIVVGKLLWQPFDTRFGTVLKRFELHTQFLKDEMNLVQLKLLVSHNEAQAQERKREEEFRLQSREYFDLVAKMDRRSEVSDSSLDRWRQWLNPPCFVEEFEEASSLREADTTDWFFDEPAFQGWITGDTCQESMLKSNGLFWVKGNPGCGKTILAATAVERLSNSHYPENSNWSNSHGSKSIVCYFFFNHRSPGKTQRENAYRSILVQLLQQCQYERSILDLFSFAYSSRQVALEIASRSDLLELLSVTGRLVQGVIVILDGIDECDHPDNLLEELNAAITGSGLRVLLFSRPNVAFLRMTITKDRSFTILKTAVEQDLTTYFSRHVEMLRETSLLLGSESDDLLIQHLLAGADGMFLWARLMMDYLKSPALIPATRLATIESLERPERLDDMYIRVLCLIAKGTRQEQDLARRIFLWLTYARRVLAAPQVQDVITPFIPTVHTNGLRSLNRDQSGDFTDFEHTVIMTCGSLVESSYSGEMDCFYYRFIHQSVLDFFRSWSDTFNEYHDIKPTITQRYLVSKAEADAELASTCLAYLTCRPPAKPLSGDMREKACQAHVKAGFPFLSYASLYWPTHLVNATAEPDRRTRSISDMFLRKLDGLLHALSQFLSDKFVLMSWVESAYLFTDSKCYDEVRWSQDMHEWSAWAQQLDENVFHLSVKDVPAELCAFSKDISKMHRLWGRTLSVASHQIWNDVTAFTPSPFFMQTSATCVRSFFTSIENWRFKSLFYAFQHGISGVTRRRTISCVKRLVFGLWRQLTSQESTLTLTNECSGWAAQYEIWYIGAGDPQRVEVHRFLLDDQEVSLQVRNFMSFVSSRDIQGPHNNGSKNWALNFPTSISNDLRSFFVLRTIYTSKSESTAVMFDSGMSGNSWRSSIIPVEHQCEAAELSLKDATKVNLEATRYQFDRSDNGHYVLYQKNKIISGWRNEDVVISVAVFQLDSGHEKDVYHLVGRLEDQLTCRGLKPTSSYIRPNAFQLHPHLPLLVFSVRSFTSPSSIMLWDFLNSTLEARMNPENVSEEMEAHVVCRTKLPIKQLHFSACGTQVLFNLLKYDGQLLPKFHCVTENIVYQKALAHASPKIVKQGEPLLEKELSLRSTTSVSLAIETSPKSIRSGHVTLTQTTGAESLHHISFAARSSEKTIEVVRHDGSNEQRQPIISLPKWDGIKEVSASVWTPTTREERITIVLNKVAKPWHSFSDPVDENLPAVIRKDVRALAKTRKRNAEGIFVTSAEQASSEGGWLVGKRTRLVHHRIEERVDRDPE